MKIRNPHKRLASLWGFIDRQHNELIASKIVGQRVLDIGCGYGSLVNFLLQQGYGAEGIDPDEESLAVARTLFPGANLRKLTAEDSRRFYPAGAFDAIVLKDSLHHLVKAGDARECFESIRRLLKAGGRLVVFDPNPHWILRLARRLALHRDFEVQVDEALQLLEQEGFAVRGLEFFELIGLPLSGGYVGFRLVPNLAALNDLVARANWSLSAAVSSAGLGRSLCWRYLVYGDLLRQP